MGMYFYLLIILLFTDVNGLIIPEELPSILSLVFANIPPVKKGTDSRIGLGFRLGEHADFQTIVELGPQKETQPIGNSESKRRRQIVVDQVTEKNSRFRNKSTINSDKINHKQAELKKIDREKERPDENWLFKWSREFEKTRSYKIPLTRNPTTLNLRVNVDSPP
ncbi:snustorr snarlik isoform X2 [Cotesia typhae]|uniref:snustorr snarlik isoform X2 n=1 Tax=Cotesia typhae TaxID=2053667 RepID=UPI003D684ED5